MNVAGGATWRDRTVEDCLRSCVNTIYCVGIDIDRNQNAPFCWLTILPDAGGPMVPRSGVTHYVLTRNPGCLYMGESVPRVIESNVNALRVCLVFYCILCYCVSCLVYVCYMCMAASAKK